MKTITSHEMWKMKEPQETTNHLSNLQSQVSDSQEMTGSGWQNSISTVSESECLHCSVGEIIMASASLLIPKSRASDWWNLTQNPAIQGVSAQEENDAEWLASFPISLFPSRQCRQVEK